MDSHIDNYEYSCTILNIKGNILRRVQSLHPPPLPKGEPFVMSLKEISLYQALRRCRGLCGRQLRAVATFILSEHIECITAKNC